VFDGCERKEYLVYFRSVVYKMATADGIQAFVETTIPKSTNEINDQQSDVVRQYLSKKTAWISPNEEQFDALVKFLEKRLNEGHNETILEIGTGGNCSKSKE
jgi:hypothetical protein